MLSNEEKESFEMIKNLTNKNTITLKNSHFKTGQIILFSYTAKFSKNPYDKTPLVFVLGSSGKKYLYGLNFNWIPPPLRKGIINMIWKSNKKNIAKGKDLVIPRNLVKVIFRNGIPAFRKYLKERISTKGVVVPHVLYPKLITLRAEHFIGISSDDAWKIAVRSINKRKRK